jgi:hypothetical protein
MEFYVYEDVVLADPEDCADLGQVDGHCFEQALCTARSLWPTQALRVVCLDGVEPEQRRYPAVAGIASDYDMPQIIAMDDWMVWGRAADGRVVQTVAEMWPEWLDQPKAPEDMGTEEYRAAVLRILRHKRPRWTNAFGMAIDAEECEMIAADLAAMEPTQAAFIAAHLREARHGKA